MRANPRYSAAQPDAVLLLDIEIEDHDDFQKLLSVLQIAILMKQFDDMLISWTEGYVTVVSSHGDIMISWE